MRKKTLRSQDRDKPRCAPTSPQIRPRSILVALKNSNSKALLYGFGVFTTAAFAAGESFLWEKHWRRLKHDAAKIGLDILSIAEADVKRAVQKEVSGSGLTSGRVRITLMDGSAAGLWRDGGGPEAIFSVLVAGFRPIPAEFKLTVSPHRINTTSPLAGIKSCNYLEPLISFEEANRRGFAEAIRLNERSEIASACMANVFWLKGKKLFTPSLRTGCLAGTTREYVLENLECEEVEAGIDALTNADEIFLTSAGIGIVQVAELNGRPLQQNGHPITKVLPV